MVFEKALSPLRNSGVSTLLRWESLPCRKQKQANKWQRASRPSKTPIRLHKEHLKKHTQPSSICTLGHCKIQFLHGLCDKPEKDLTKVICNPSDVGYERWKPASKPNEESRKYLEFFHHRIPQTSPHPQNYHPQISHRLLTQKILTH